MRHELGYHQGMESIQPSNGRFYSLQPPPPGPATPGGSLAARGRPQCRPGPRAPAHPGGGGGGAQEQVQGATSRWPQGGGVVADTVSAPRAPVRKHLLGARLGPGFVVAVIISTICRLSCRSRSRRRRLQPCYRPPRGQTAPRACSQMPCPPSRASGRSCASRSATPRADPVAHRAGQRLPQEQRLRDALA